MKFTGLNYLLLLLFCSCKPSVGRESICKQAVHQSNKFDVPTECTHWNTKYDNYKII